ncbi:MAG TPA: hypothetical protein VHX49_07925 [Candidatus Acidoferrales bacterium]|jgi:hypothetical protein|nr:hypothetical protein [Candidatus Acidoferrales bacterium]
MRRAILIFAFLAWLGGPAAKCALAQTQQQSSAQALPAGAAAQSIDGIAARIEDDILTDSEVDELGAFQKLVEGQAKPRDELIRELSDQWIVRGEADASKYPQPSAQDVDRAYQQLVAQLSSPQEFEKRRVAVGLSDAAVRRMLAAQLYLSRFLDYRFRPAAQVDDKQIQAYYDDEFAPQLKARGEKVPSIDDVEDTIREVLIQRDIDTLARQWLDDTRNHLKIDIVADGEEP